MMNEQFIKGKWKEMKGEIQKKWGELTNDELEKTKGDMKAVSGLIQQKYGQKKDEISRNLDELTAKYAQGPIEKVKESLKKDTTKNTNTPY